MLTSTTLSVNKSARGFTLVELLVVISIIAILSVIGMTIFSSAQRSARDGRRRGDLKAISNALELYKAASGQYPSSGVSGSGGTAWFCSQGRYWDTDPVLKAALTPYFSGSLPVDPINDNTFRYRLDLTVDQYFLYAALENPSATVYPITGDGCVGPGGSAHLLITNQQ